VKKFLLDTNILVAYLRGRSGTVKIVQPWLVQQEVTTSLIAYTEACEFLQGFPDYIQHRNALRILLRQLTPYVLTYPILERYAELRRSLRPPYGPGLIGDLDTFIAATAIEHNVTLVTTDSDFARVPGLTLMKLDRSILKA